MSAPSKPRRKAARGHKLPQPFPLGYEVTDLLKKVWVFGNELGTGGFGVIYLATSKDEQSSSKSSDFEYVIKVEYHGNGPLFAETHCYNIVGRISQIQDWIKKKKLPYLGMSPCFGTGSFEYNNEKYRFMVLEKYGIDLQKLIDLNGTLPLKTAYTVAISVINVLEYIHQYEYLHNDIKPANLLLGSKKGTENQVYLIDFGLAHKYLYGDKTHKKSVIDPRRAHDGTIEYTSRDAHRGSCSRRSDLEVLGLNVVHWLSGRLPWEGMKDVKQVQELKCRYMNDIPSLLKKVFTSNNYPAKLSDYLSYVAKLEFDETPDYDYCKKVLVSGIISSGERNDGVLVFPKMAKKSSKLPVMPSDSEKENNKKKTQPKVRQTKRKEKPEFTLNPGVIPTPAMLAVMNKMEVKSEKPPKTPKKKSD